MPTSPLRKFVLPSCNHWFSASRASKGADATMAMEQCVNHLENALIDAIQAGYRCSALDQEIVARLTEHKTLGYFEIRK